jgi:hypothetical protein
MAGKKLVQHHLFRVCYRTEAPEDCVSGNWSGGGRRMTVVADTVEEAIERVKQHENGCGSVTFGEVVRENLEVWS